MKVKANMNPEENISSIVSKTLYVSELGISSRIADMHKNWVNTKQMLFAAVHPETLQTFEGGSNAEGTRSRGCDVDKMTVVPNISVLSNRGENIFRRGHIFRMDSRNCRAGFYRLVSQQLQSRKDDFFDYYEQDIKDMLERDNEDCSFLSSDKMYQFSVIINKKNDPFETEYYRHGPAAGNFYSIMNNEVSDEFNFDNCLCLRVDEWPAELDEWVTRQRTYNWPQKDLIAKIRSLDCHFVPIGDKTSQNSHLEWRLSFLLCELELVWSFNDIQIQLYFLLKSLLKSELEQLYPDQLSSYCMKTVVFWYSESHDTNEWSEYNLLGLVKDCLLFLLSCIENRELQHFFDRTRNLLYSKFTDENETRAVLEKINEITENVIVAVLNTLKQKNVSDAWRMSDRDPKKFLILCEFMDFLGTSFPKYRYQHEQLSIYQLLVVRTFNQLVRDNVSKLSKKARYFDTHACNHIDADFLLLVKKIIAIRRGVCYSQHQDTIEQDEPDRQLQNLEVVEGTLSGVGDIDRLAGYLYLATFYLYRNRSGEVINTLVNIMKMNSETCLIYPGHCSKKRGIGMTSTKMLFQTECPLLTEDTNITPLVGFDVMFSDKDIQFVPHPVKYECALLRLVHEGLIMIHPVIYLYVLSSFTMYNVGNFEASNEYLVKLEEAVTDAKGGKQYFRALNLLGYCYLRNRLFLSAYQCFEDSMYWTAGHFKNAAIYHIALLIFTLMQNGLIDIRTYIN